MNTSYANGAHEGETDTVVVWTVSSQFSFVTSLLFFFWFSFLQLRASNGVTVPAALGLSTAVDRFVIRSPLLYTVSFYQPAISLRVRPIPAQTPPSWWWECTICTTYDARHIDQFYLNWVTDICQQILWSLRCLSASTGLHQTVTISARQWEHYVAQRHDRFHQNRNKKPQKNTISTSPIHFWSPARFLSRNTRSQALQLLSTPHTHYTTPFTYSQIPHTCFCLFSHFQPPTPIPKPFDAFSSPITHFQASTTPVIPLRTFRRAPVDPLLIFACFHLFLTLFDKFHSFSPFSHNFAHFYLIPKHGEKLQSVSTRNRKFSFEQLWITFLVRLSYVWNN